MLIPIEVLESDIKSLGLSSGVPKSEHIFISGREDRIEDAPLGYYRFHYWINSDTAKPHENYVFVGKNAGFISISMMQEKDNRWRLLFRSAMGWKSIILDSKVLISNSKSSGHTAVLRDAMKMLSEHLFPDESTTQPSGLYSPLDMVSIGINTNDSPKEDQNVSRNSSLNSIRSSYTLSALRSSFAGSQESVSFSRFGSMLSLSDVPNYSFDDLSYNDERKLGIIDDLTVNFFKYAFKVKDASFSSNLLDLEKALTPKTFNYDVLNLTGNNAECFSKFQQSLGEEINKKETINYITILTEKYKLVEVISPGTSSKIENLSTHADDSNNVNNTKLNYIISEFIETEHNYVQQLYLIEKIFISHLKFDDSGKFILKIKDFKDIFDGIVDFIPKHQEFLSNLRKAPGIDNFLISLNELTNSKCLYAYQSYFTTYEKRIAALKSCLDLYPKFAQFHDNCVDNVPELNKKGLDQLFISPIQRIPRYALLLKEASKYVTDPSRSESLKVISDEIGKVAQFLNTTKHKSEQTEMLFTIQRKVNNFPPDFLRAERTFLTKLACFMIDPVDSKVSKTRLTIYLCNDMMIFAKKRTSCSGFVTHDFILAVNIKHVQMNASRNKKGDKMLLNAEIDMEHAWFTHNIPDLDSTVFGRKNGATIPNLNDCGIVCSNFQFSPKNQKKISSFLNEFTEAKNQMVLSESPAKLIFKQEDKFDIFFHIFESKDQIQWESKSQVLIVYIEDNIDLKDNIDILSQYAAVAVVQGRSNTFRFLIGTKNHQFSDVKGPCFETGLDLVDISAFSKEFNKAILNAHLLLSIYPPYSRNVNQQRRFVLESAVAASKSGSLSSINKASGIRGFFSGLTGGSEKLNTDRLSRGSSLKNGSSPLSSPAKQANIGRMDELKREIQLESSMSHLHL